MISSQSKSFQNSQQCSISPVISTNYFSQNKSQEIKQMNSKQILFDKQSVASKFDRNYFSN